MHARGGREVAVHAVWSRGTGVLFLVVILSPLRGPRTPKWRYQRAAARLFNDIPHVERRHPASQTPKTTLPKFFRSIISRNPSAACSSGNVCPTTGRSLPDTPHSRVVFNASPIS